MSRDAANSDRFAAERSFLVALLRVALGTARPDDAAVPASVDWPRFFALLERHREQSSLELRFRS